MEGKLIYEKNDETNRYKLKIYDPRNILLVGFLLDEIGDDPSFFIEWLKNSESELWPNSELVDCMKEGDLVELTPAYIIDNEKIYATGNFFQIPINLLANLVKRWAAVKALKPQYIKIVINNNETKVEDCDKMAM